MKHTIYHVNSFTSKNFNGNPTVAVFDADHLDVEAMQKIAMEMNHSETGFIFRSQKGDYRFRFFTRDGTEIGFCGHATLGALTAIREEKQYTGPLKIETNVGLLECHIRENSIEMDVPDVNVIPIELSHDELEAGMGLAHGSIDRSVPICKNTLDNMVYFHVSTMDKMEALKPNFEQTRQFALKHGFHVLSAVTSSPSAELDVFTRAFVPHVGVPEDPFTGSMQYGAVAYLLLHNKLDKNAFDISLGQGDFLRRIGRATLHRKQDGGASLEARAKVLFRSSIQIKEE